VYKLCISWNSKEVIALTSSGVKRKFIVTVAAMAAELSATMLRVDTS